MAGRRSTWRHRTTAVGLTAAAALAPFIATPAANAASLCGPPADTIAPQITGLTLSASSIDLNSGPRTVAVTADAIDTSGNGEPSGVKDIEVFTSGPGGGTVVALSLASGTATDGVWTGTVTMPPTARPGTWRIREIGAVDAARNRQEYGDEGEHPESPSDLRLQAGWQTSFAVTGTVATPPPPVTAGKLTGFTVTPQTVDTTAAPRTVHVSATFSAHQPKRVAVDFEHPSGPGRRYYPSVQLTRSGSHWTGHLKVPEWAGDIKARPVVSAVFGSNVKPRYREDSAAVLQAKGFSSKLTIVSGIDTTKPSITGLTFAPPTIDTTTGAKLLTVTATVSDAQSGVKEVHAYLNITNGSGGSAAGFYPYPGLGFTKSGGASVRLTHTTGDTWTGTATIRRCEPGGTWKVNVSAGDRASNNADLSSNQLIAAGLPGTLAVTSTPGDVEAPYLQGATALSVQHWIILNFTEGVKNVDTSTLSIYALKPVAARYQSTVPISDISCSNGTSDVDCSGSGGLVTSAILTVPTLASAAQYRVYANLNWIPTQLTDGAGNPMSWNYEIADVTGS